MSVLFRSLGVGVGLRPIHYAHFLEQRPRSVDWFEVISENYMDWDNLKLTRPRKILHQLRRDYNIALHGVSLSIGSADSLNLKYLSKLKSLIQEIEPKIVSDHLCWTGVNGENLHDLMPVPFTEDALKWIIDKTKRVQDFLGRRILLENPSSYLDFASSEMKEWEFLSELINQADCGLLLDINNVYVSSVNHQFDAKKYLDSLPHFRVGQIHLAGHSKTEHGLIDTHDHPVCDEVWDLYRWYVRKYGFMSSMIERDDDIPEWPELEKEVLMLKEIEQEAHRAQRADLFA